MLQILSPSDNLGSWYISSLQFSLTQLYESLGVSYCTSEHYLLYSSEKRRHLFEVPNDQYQRKQWQSTPVLLPGKSHGGGAWQAAIHGVATIDQFAFSRNGITSFFFSLASFIQNNYLRIELYCCMYWQQQYTSVYKNCF